MHASISKQKLAPLLESGFRLFSPVRRLLEEIFTRIRPSTSSTQDDTTQRKERKDSPLPREAVTTPRKVLIPFRPPRYSSIYLHYRALQIWRAILCTLPFDLLLPYASWSLPEDPWATVVVIAAGLSFLGTFRERIFSAFRWLREMRDSRLQSYAGIGALLFAAVSIVEILLRVKSFGGYALLAGAVILFPTAIAVRRLLLDAQARHAMLKRDRVLWVNQINLQNFVIAVIPMILARLVATLGTLVGVATNSPTISVTAALALGLLLLVSAYPAREHFVVNCSNCGNWTSRALQGIGFCPSCAVEQFEVLEEPGTGSTDQA